MGGIVFGIPTSSPFIAIALASSTSERLKGVWLVLRWLLNWLLLELLRAILRPSLYSRKTDGRSVVVRIPASSRGVYQSLSELVLLLLGS